MRSIGTQRKFGGTKYEYAGYNETKGAAQDRADTLRHWGKSARIVKMPANNTTRHQTIYTVWSR